MKRAVLFVVRGDEVQGAGQIGFDVDAEPDDHARSIRLPMGESSVITEAADRRETWQGEIPRTPTNEKLLGQLGGEWPKRAVVVPLMVREGVGLVLYGDNGLEDRALGPVEELEWALLEAGLSMERDLLEEPTAGLRAGARIPPLRAGEPRHGGSRALPDTTDAAQSARKGRRRT